MAETRVFDASGIPPGEFDWREILNIKRPDSLDIQPDLDQVDLVYGAGTTIDDIGSIATERGDFRVRFKISAIHKLPHDMVQTSLSRIQESTMIEGLTPDIVMRDTEGGIHIIEISTTRSLSLRAQRDDVMGKLNKYRHLLGSPDVKTLSAISVSSVGVVTNLVNHEEFIQHSEPLRKAYIIGLEIVRQIVDELDYNPTDDPSAEVRSYLKNFKFPLVQPNGRATKFHIDDDYHNLIRDIDVDHTLHDYSMDIFKLPTFNDWFESGEDGRYTDSPVIHLPLFRVTTQLKNVSLIPLDDGHEMTVGFGIPYMDDTMSKTLRQHRVVKESVKKQTESEKCKWVNLTSEHRLHLAKRGVMAKELCTHPDLLLHRALKKRPISKSSPTQDISDYIESPLRSSFKKDHYKCPKGFLDAFLRDGSSYSPESLLELMVNTDLVEELTNLSIILSEVILEMKMNPRDTSTSKMFVVKRLPNDITIVIRPTRYGGQSESHVFFQIISYHPVDVNPVSETFHRSSTGMFATKFMSITRERAEHLVNIVEQVLGIWFYLIDEIGPGLKVAVSDDIYKLSPTLKYLTLVLLEGKEYTSRNLQHLRYYYMDLISTAGPSRYNLKFINKLDSNCRSRLFLYTMMKLKDIHNSDSVRILMIDTNQPDSGDDTVEDRLLKTAESREVQISIPTPASYTATSMQQLLLMMYVCVLHNKNEQENTLSAKQIVSKIVKMEVKSKDMKWSKGDPSQDVKVGDYTDLDWSIRLVKHSSLLMKLALEKIHGDLHLIAASACAQTQIHDLATTKSSHSGIDQSKVFDDKDLHTRCSRSKCFLEFCKHSKSYLTTDLVHNLPFLVQSAVESGSKIHVKMFKKNQIGGTREIMILDFISRSLIRILEDVSRGIASVCEVDMLTKPKLKHKVMTSHMRENTSVSSYTKRYSLDKTTWCQRFTNPVFYTMLSTMMPEYEGLFRFILNLHTNKEIELPEALLRSFLNAVAPNLEFYEVDDLYKEFHGMTPEFLLGRNSTTIKNTTNMMQGILHYTSTLLHCCFIYYLKSELPRIVDKVSKLRSVTLNAELTAQVSSDDSGLLLTVSGESLKQIDVKLLFGGFEAFMFTSERAFCMRTSIEKSTMTTLPLYEFNSVFFSGNNIASPLIKFIARSMDDNVAETLRARVDGMYSNLRELRSNGATGALCSSINMLQHLALMSSFGLKTMNFFDEYSEPIYDSKLSHLGFLLIHPPMIAGLFGSEFSDYYVCKQDETNRRLKMICTMRRSPTLTSDEDLVNSLVLRMWPTARYIRSLSSVGIDRSDILKSEFDDLEIMLRKPTSAPESVERVKFSVCSSSIARCFSQLCRADNQFAQAYLLWDKVFTIGDKKLALDEFRDLLSTSEVQPTLDVFPLRADYDYYIRLLKQPILTHYTGKTYAMRHQGYAVMHSLLPSSRELTNLLLYDWFGFHEQMSIRQRSLVLSKVKKIFPWYDSDRHVSLTNSGFQYPLQLINYLSSYTDKAQGFYVIAAGHTNSFHNVVEGLLPLNTFKRHHTAVSGVKFLSLTQPLIQEDRSNLIKMFENRILDWNLLATCVDTPKKLKVLSDEMIQDLLPLILEHIDELRSGTGSTNDDFFRHCLLSMKHSAEIYSALRSIPRPQILYHQMQIRSGRQWSGYGKMLYHTSHGSAIVEVYDREITSIRASNRDINYEHLMSQLSVTLPSDVVPVITDLALIVPHPSCLIFNKVTGRSVVTLGSKNGKPLLRIDVKPRVTSGTLPCRSESPLISSWLLREDDPVKWVNSFHEDYDEFVKIFLDVVRYIILRVRTTDERLVQKETLGTDYLNDWVESKVELAGGFDDFLLEFAAGLVSTEENVLEPDNGIDLEQFMPSDDPTLYTGIDLGRLLYHPFARLFSLPTFDKLPLIGVLGCIKLMVQFEQSTLSAETFKNYRNSGCLTPAALELMDNQSFVQYVKDFVINQREDRPSRRSRVKDFGAFE